MTDVIAPQEHTGLPAPVEKLADMVASLRRTVSKRNDTIRSQRADHLRYRSRAESWLNRYVVARQALIAIRQLDGHDQAWQVAYDTLGLLSRGSMRVKRAAPREERARVLAADAAEAEDPDPIVVGYFPLAAALGRALEHDSEAFWLVVAELDKTFPHLDWKNAMTDG